MRRRFFLAAFVSAASFPVLARSQQSLPIVGVLGSASLSSYGSYMKGFFLSLREAGFAEGRDVIVEQRWADGNYDRVKELAADLASRRLSVIFASGNPAAIELKKITSTIPVVFTIGLDPIKYAFAASMNRPAGNMTGTVLYSSDLITKRMEMLKELNPSASRFAFLVSPRNPNLDDDTRTLTAAALSAQRSVLIARASNDGEIEVAFDTMKEDGVDAAIISPDAYFADRSEQIVALAARHKLPTIYDRRNSASAGGLIAYGPSFIDSYHRAGILVGRVLKGEKPADLPVELPTKFELVVNLRTARTLGLEVPQSILALADEIID
jgi:putative ABC transport system substrate-binding protein